MTMSLARGLLDCKEGFDLEKVAKWYANWINSKPFDCGITIGNSIGCFIKGAKVN